MLRHALRRTAWLAALSLFAGCKLVDQNTFAPAPEPQPAEAAAPAPATASLEARRALVTIDFANPAPDYQQLLGYAVRAAENRDRNVQFDVVAVLPELGMAEQGQRNAAEVMRAIMANGVPAERIHLRLRAQPGLATRQVRVYVR